MITIFHAKAAPVTLVIGRHHDARRLRDVDRLDHTLVLVKPIFLTIDCFSPVIHLALRVITGDFHATHPQTRLSRQRYSSNIDFHVGVEQTRIWSINRAPGELLHGVLYARKVLRLHELCAMCGVRFWSRRRVLLAAQPVESRWPFQVGATWSNASTHSPRNHPRYLAAAERYHDDLSLRRDCAVDRRDPGVTAMA
jgi:hypothetical protein